MAKTDNVSELIKQHQSLNKILYEQKILATALGQSDVARSKEVEIYYNNEKLINELKTNSNKLTESQKKLLNDLEASQRKLNVELSKEEKLRQRNLNIQRELTKQLNLGWDYLIKSDKVIRQTILNLGISGTKAELMRTSFENSALQVAHLGGTLEDVQTIMQGYADETGRARVLSAEMVNNIELIGKGTGLGVEQATKLGAQFELMGFDAKTTMEYVQGVVDTSERMGVNTTKVLKNITDNFKKLNTYTFQQGVKGFAQMAEYAEKFKIDINDALNAANVAKSLEGAIDLAAQLQIMGGEFAKTDPFEMLFLSRNDPAKFTEKIADMTKGVVSFRKMSDGTFEKFISPADRDRLAAVAKSLGMEASQLTQIAERQAEIQKMRTQMQGMGLTDQQKELIEGAAFFNKKSGKFQVQLAGQMKDISSLTESQANSFVKENKSLKERAIAAQDFETALKATIEEFKTILLPMLRGINGVLTTIRPIASGLAKLFNSIAKTDIGANILKGAGMLMTAGFLFNKAFSKITGKGIFGKIFSKKDISTKTEKTGSGLFEQRKGIGAGALAKGQGIKALGQGAGFGAAMAGAGAGIMLAATGISKLADSMSKLTKEQAESLSSIVKSLSKFMMIGAGAAVALMALGAAGKGGAIGLLAIGAAFLMIGASIGIAAAGIGYMSKGLAELVTAGSKAGPSMTQLAGGVGELSLAMMGMGLGIGGVLSFSLLMNKIAKHSPALAVVGDAFKNISTVLSGSKDDFLAVQNAVESISKMNIKGGNTFAELASLLKTPIKVEFADKQVVLANDISLNIDGQKFMQRVYDHKVAIQKDVAARQGKSNGT